ncbi:MAG: helix-turn-helix transcriptional regulator [Betaproteobacteria bacterium]|nr:helix-turn-helix transcriptional regulator [Betaproteobacteria bacterium]
MRFGDFMLDIANAQLIRQGQPVELPPKSFALLAYLAQRPGELVLKDTLLDVVWGRRFVSEGAVKTVVSELRAALRDDARAPLWIETVQRRGYRFVGRLQPLPFLRRGRCRPGGDPCGNLPLSLTPAIAREAEGAALDTLLANHRLVTLTGAAGVGKTRLALSRALARRTDYADGAWLLELAPLAADTCDEATLRATLASALQLDSAAAAANDALVRALRPMTLLLVVDNAEHVLRPLAPLLAHLHVQLPQLHLLVTSREPLHIPGEHVLRLAPLSVPAPEWTTTWPD